MCQNIKNGVQCKKKYGMGFSWVFYERGNGIYTPNIKIIRKATKKEIDKTKKEALELKKNAFKIGRYTGFASESHIVVGCQEIPWKTVKAIYTRMLKLRKWGEVKLIEAEIKLVLLFVVFAFFSGMFLAINDVPFTFINVLWNFFNIFLCFLIGQINAITNMEDSNCYHNSNKTV